MATGSRQKIAQGYIYVLTTVTLLMTKKVLAYS